MSARGEQLSASSPKPFDLGAQEGEGNWDHLLRHSAYRAGHTVPDSATVVADTEDVAVDGGY